VIGPAPILAAIVALFHVSAYVFIRGRAGARLPLLLIAAWLGAWAGDTVGGRIAADPLRIGEFNLVFASLVAWLAIGLVAILALLVPERAGPRQAVVVSTERKRGAPPASETQPGPVGSEPEPQPR
jgi:hypothetical protein